MQQKNLLDREKVFVEEAQPELDIDTVNLMGSGNAISQRQLQDIHQQLQRLQSERLDIDRDHALREGQLKSQVSKVREEKAAVEKQLFDTEFLLGERDSELQKMRENFIKEKEQLRERMAELEDKVSFFRKN